MLYPGIPSDYRTWPVEEKESWLANAPAALAFAEQQRRMLDPRTPEGVYNLTLAQTGDVQLAEAAMIEAKVQLKLAGLPQGGM